MTSEDQVASGNRTDQICLSSLKKHWAEAQIDGPVQATARYDDVAKLLITIGGFVLAVLAGAYSVMVRDLRGVVNVPLVTTISAVIFLSMLVFFVFAALVCYWQPKMRAQQIMALKDDQKLECEVAAWCEDIDRVIEVKKVLLKVSIGAFIVSFLAMMLFLLSLISLAR